MLQKLYIRNYAIIDDLTIQFHPRFNIITGETGAGKSILMGALGLVLGNRADTSVLYDNSQKCFAEASFSLQRNTVVKRLLAENELDEEEMLVVRREISANGKSRSFINDTAVTLAVLRLFAAQLVDLHQQFDTLELANDDFQREVVDVLAGHADLLKTYRSNFNQYTKASKQLQQLKAQQVNASKELDYFRFLFDELEEVGLKANEIEEWEAEQKLLENAENIKTVLDGASYVLKNNEQPIVQQIRQIVQQLHSLKEVHAGITDIAARLQATQIELKDIADEVESINDSINTDATRLDEVNERLNKAYKLLKKHNAADTAALIAIRNNLEFQLLQVVTIDQEISALEKESQQLFQFAKANSEKITANRKDALPEFEKHVKVLLHQVGMPNAVLKISIHPLNELTAYGADNIQFLFDGNRSGRFEPLQKVASGGELSRLMLSIKSIVARSMQMPTLIFDEIDTGISGEAAKQVGIIMKNLAQHHQVLSITHQPQIAARAEAHYFVYKKEKDGRIKTQVRLLGDDERVDTIAHMLSGEQLTESALKTAKEMVGRSN